MVDGVAEPGDLLRGVDSAIAGVQVRYRNSLEGGSERCAQRVVVLTSDHLRGYDSRLHGLAHPDSRVRRYLKKIMIIVIGNAALGKKRTTEDTR